MRVGASSHIDHSEFQRLRNFSLVVSGVTLHEVMSPAGWVRILPTQPPHVSVGAGSVDSAPAPDRHP